MATKKSKNTSNTTNNNSQNPPQEHPRLRSQVAIGIPNFHRLYDRGFRSSRGIMPTSVSPVQTEGHRKLADEVEGLEVTYDQVTQLPNFIVSQEPQTGLAKRTGET